MAADAPVLILASEDELPIERRVWGCPNRELPPDRREALDWLMLCRFLGWEAQLERGLLRAEQCAGRRCLIVARDPQALAENEVSVLERVLDTHRVLVVTRMAPAGSALARLSGVQPGAARSVSSVPRWAGPGPAPGWVSHLELELPTLTLAGGAVPWAFAGSAPLVVARRLGAGTIATCTAHPSVIRDRNPSGTGVLKMLLTWGSPGPAAWLDLDRTLVLRMDDPGSAGNAHLHSWAHRPLSEGEWQAIATDLVHRGARMTVGYVPGWIDDGNPDQGALAVAGREAKRVPAAIHPAPLVTYRASRSGGEQLHDHVAEHRGIQALLEAGAGDVELHGYTHVRESHSEWATAADRYEEVSWYRELETFAAGDGNPLSDGLQVIQRFFGTTPTSLLCPGQACSEAAGEKALDAGLALVATETLALSDREHLCWDSHVISPGLGWPNGALLESGLPTIACFHDSDPVAYGPGWIANRLDEWRVAGARRLIDFRQLAAALQARIEIEERGDGPLLRVEGWSGAGAPAGLPVAFRCDEQPSPTRVQALVNGKAVELVCERTESGADLVIVPPVGQAPA